MKKKIGISSLIATILFIYNLNLCLAQPFKPATTISDANGYSFVQQFKEVYKKNVISGGVITKEALEAILHTANCNAITYRFAVDTVGTFAPKGEIFIILSGAKETDQSGGIIIEAINAPKYVPRHWCPPSCMSFIISNKTGGQITVE